MYGQTKPAVVRRPLAEEERAPIEERPPGWRPALPATCLQVLTSPRPRDCVPNCQGVQPDGTCAADLIRAANERNIPWEFDLDRDGQWIYCGPEIP